MNPTHLQTLKIYWNKRNNWISICFALYIKYHNDIQWELIKEFSDNYKKKSFVITESDMIDFDFHWSELKFFLNYFLEKLNFCQRAC